MCKATKPVEDFPLDGRPGRLLKRGGRAHNCLECHRKVNNGYTFKRRIAVLKYYSAGTMRCACCGEGQYEFLGIDHVNGGGGQHRKDPKMRGVHFYRWLVREGFPEGYQVLCHNCNMAKGFYGMCPHEMQTSTGA